MASPIERKRILVVDDDPDICKLLKAALRSAGDVEAAQNGSEALARVSRTPPVHLIICDIMMPELDGIEFVKRLHLLPDVKSVPVFFLTAKGTAPYALAGIQLGVKAFITKPFVVDELLKKVQKQLRG
jgi:CheY-like chemotaxis protein